MSQAYWVLGHRAQPLQTIGDYGLVEILSRPGVPGPPPHFHEDAAEFFYVADGSLSVQVEGEWRTLSTGESLCLEPGTTHTLMNRSDRDVRWVTGWSPRGFERFFVDFGVAVEEPDAMRHSTSEELVRRVIADCSRYGMILEQR